MRLKLARPEQDLDTFAAQRVHTEPFSSFGLAGLRDVDDFGRLPGGFTTPRVGTPPGINPFPSTQDQDESLRNPPVPQGTAQVPVHCGLAFTT
jgi:hypothetical protein